jgi:hypothetical protein
LRHRVPDLFNRRLQLDLAVIVLEDRMHVAQDVAARD